MTPEEPKRLDTLGLPTTSGGGKDAGNLTGISGLFGLDPSKASVPARDTPRPSGQTSGFTLPGSTPTSRYVPLPDDATPKTLQGRYRLIAQLGMGGMGVTYRAWDSQDGVPVVIKMPRKDVRNNPEIMDRFTREVRTMLELSHEHIVPITDHGEEEGCPFVAMRFLPGGSLSEYRGRNEDGSAAILPPATLRFWLPGIARALDFMHSSGVLHRDVKPGNIFLDAFLKPFLGDFGIAKIVDESAGLNREYTLTATRMAVGTPEYMAPELFRPGVVPDGRVDQYALAVTVYEMLAGRKPFRGDSAHIIVEHASKDVPSLQDFCPEVPRRLSEAVHRALAKNPDDRFASCSEFAEAVLAQASALEIDTSRARLLCPSCRAILRVPMSAGGRRGKCPKCSSPMAVADDLCSLWLGGEDRSSGEAAAGPEDAANESIQAESADGVTASSWKSRATVFSTAVAGAAILGFAVAWLSGSLIRQGIEQRHQVSVSDLHRVLAEARNELQQERANQTSSREQAAADRRRLDEAQTVINKLQTQLESERKAGARNQAAMAAQNQRPSEGRQPSALDKSTLPGQAALMAIQAIDREREDLGRWGGKGRVVYGKVEGIQGGEVASFTRLWQDGSFATSLFPGRSVTFYKHGCERLVAPITNEVQPTVFDAGVLSFTRSPSDRLRSVRGTASRSPPERDAAPIRVALYLRNNDPVYDDWGHRGGSLSVGVDSATVKPGGNFTFSGLSPIPYYLSLTCPGFIVRNVDIDLEKRGVIDLGDLVLDKAPVLDIRYRARVRPKGKDWVVDEDVRSTTVVCDGQKSFQFSDTRDSYGNTLSLRMAPDGGGVKASFFYRSGEPFFDLGSEDIVASANFDAVAQRQDRQGASEMRLQHGHAYLFKIKHMEGTDIELLFQPSVR